MTDVEPSAPMILLVDDEDVIRMMGKDILRVLGYQTMVASNGDEAIKVYRDNKDHIALIILDWHMPGMGGLEILEQLWAINDKVKVILSTGWGPPREMDEIMKSGHIIGLLQKPYLVKDLQNEIAKFLAK